MPEATSQQIKTIAIVGVGLIGGSFALAIRKCGFAGEILGVSSPSVIEKAIRGGAISSGASLQTACEEADLLYLADRVDGIIETLHVIGPLARPGCLITDAGSTKRIIVETARQAVQAASFVGGHPMAGKELRGIENAEPDLFCGRPYVLTGATRESPIVSEFEDLLRSLQVQIVRMSPEEHDTAVAFTSHLPQLLSTALAKTLAEPGDRAFHNVVGPGLLDMTRLALSAPDLWTSILRTNHEAVTHALDAFISNLNSLRTYLASDDALAHEFVEAAVLAQQIRTKI
ncbi:MAG: prephenate dehydrogenase [Bryobacteraceae bacterium]